MKLQKIYDAYDSYSGKASSIVRQLAFAGIAVVWIFRIGNSNAVSAIPAALLLPLTFFVATLAADFLHYFAATIMYRLFYAYLEHTHDTHSGDKDIGGIPWWINLPGDLLFWTKCVVMVFGYAGLIAYLIFS